MDDAGRPKRRGLLIVVEGLDRAGKTSQCQLLLEALTRRGHQIKYIKFPGKMHNFSLGLPTETRGQRQEHSHWQDDQ